MDIDEQLKLVLVGFVNIVREYLTIEDMISRCNSTSEWQKCCKTANLYLTDDQIRNLDRCSLTELIKQEFKNTLLACCNQLEGRILDYEEKPEEWE